MMPTCTGCAFAERRVRVSKPALHCARFHMPAVARCIDYRQKPGILERLSLPGRAAK
jgi:hypothetical protein